MSRREWFSSYMHFVEHLWRFFGDRVCVRSSRFSTCCTWLPYNETKVSLARWPLRRLVKVGANELKDFGKSAVADYLMLCGSVRIVLVDLTQLVRAKYVYYARIWLGVVDLLMAR